MRSICYGILLLVLALTMSGCKTAGTGQAGKTGYSAALSTADKIASLIQQNATHKAKRVWLDNKIFFTDNPEQVQLLKELASAVKKIISPGLRI